MDLAPLKALADKVEADVIKDVGDALVPAVMKEAVALLPEQYQLFGAGIEAALEPVLEQALNNVLAKIPQI